MPFDCKRIKIKIDPLVFKFLEFLKKIIHKSQKFSNKKQSKLTFLHHSLDLRGFLPETWDPFQSHHSHSHVTWPWEHHLDPELRERGGTGSHEGVHYPPSHSHCFRTRVVGLHYWEYCGDTHYYSTWRRHCRTVHLETTRDRGDWGLGQSQYYSHSARACWCGGGFHWVTELGFHYSPSHCHTWLGGWDRSWGMRSRNRSVGLGPTDWETHCREHWETGDVWWRGGSLWF